MGEDGEVWCEIESETGQLHMAGQVLHVLKAHDVLAGCRVPRNRVQLPAGDGVHVCWCGMLMGEQGGGLQTSDQVLHVLEAHNVLAGGYVL